MDAADPGRTAGAFRRIRGTDYLAVSAQAAGGRSGGVVQGLVSSRREFDGAQAECLEGKYQTPVVAHHLAYRRGSKLLRAAHVPLRSHTEG